MDSGIDVGNDAGTGDRRGRRPGTDCIIGTFFFTEYAANRDRECRTVCAAERRTDRIADSGTDFVTHCGADRVPNNSAYSVSDHAADGGSFHPGTN